MGKIKPLEITNRHGFAIGFVVLLFAIIGLVDKGYKFFEVIAPNNILLNWRFFIFTAMLSMMLVWFIMNHLWRKEHQEHQKTRFERDNYMKLLKLSENERLTDIITGIPNTRSLERDIENYFSENRGNKTLQFIFIDLKNFRNINRKYGFLKTNELLRTIAQSIYQKMRRNEDMYKYPIGGGDTDDSGKEGFYRVHSGGDEFAFIIEGDQSDAVGFCNRLVGQFSALSERTKDILGEHVRLSFYGAIVEMDPRDTFNDILLKTQDCYRLAKEGSGTFTICWHPNNVEKKLMKDQRKKADYEKARELFEVLTIADKEYL